MKTSLPLPEWIRPAMRKRPYLEHLGPRLRALGVSTVCESARCPNLGECFSQGEATFLLLGEVCTRNCGFCAVETGRPLPPDPEEPRRVAQAVKELELKHVVLTSVTRDDLGDGGAGQFVAALQEIRELCPQVSVELLVPDFGGNAEAAKAVAAAGPEVFAHNMETVPRLYPQVRPQADWKRSLAVLSLAREGSSSLLLKSGLMVGLGETRKELLLAFRQLREVGVDILTIGQYLQPTPGHLPVMEYPPLGVFAELAAEAETVGFRQVASAPLVRSSYRAGKLMRASDNRPSAARGLTEQG